MSSGNLPSSSTTTDQTQKFFNNFFNDQLRVSQNVDDAILGFFESVTGNRETAKTLASVVLYTSLKQGIEPMAFIEELRNLSSGVKKEVKTPIDPLLIERSHETIDDVEANKTTYESGQLFYASTDNKFYRLNANRVDAVPDYRAEQIVSTVEDAPISYNFYQVKYVSEGNELNAYLTMFLNLNRANTSLLGISNSPQTNKYITRTILL